MTHIPLPREIDDFPPCLQARYSKLMLIANEADLPRFNDDNETLIVCCDWLLWQRLAADSQHVVYYELGILDWAYDDHLDTDLHIRANDWILDHGDAENTVFHGVSLGRLFCSEASMALINFHRINRSLRGLIDRFKPVELHLFDYKYDVNRLSRNIRTRLIAAIAADCGVAFTDHSEGDIVDDDQIRGLATTRQTGPVPVRSHLCPASLIIAAGLRGQRITLKSTPPPLQ